MIFKEINFIVIYRDSKWWLLVVTVVTRDGENERSREFHIKCPSVTR